MTSRKNQELKEFLISQRKKIGIGLTSVPIWIMQKANKRFFRNRLNVHWKRTKFGKAYRKKRQNQAS